MRIKRIHIENFRAIRQLELENLGDMVVIAGSNGCGKTQIYHALRLLKSTYGGYQPNEYQQWWGEFQINLDRPGQDILRVFRDRSRPLHVRAEFAVTDSEREFLHNKAESLIRSRIWESVLGRQYAGVLGRAAFAQAQRQYGAEVEERTKNEVNAAFKALESGDLIGDLSVSSSSKIILEPNPGLELLFSTYEPDNLGVIDYHGAQRTYNREQLGGINLNIKQSEERSRQHALYNSANKYSNVKSELAAGYVRDLIAAQAGIDREQTTSLTETLQELFSNFFPGKQFPGPTPGEDGTLDFPVRLEGGLEHDIDDLSSGEKEVLFGYLRLRNSAPRNSVLLIDEPELHLNPALLRGLPQFYHKHIGRGLGNQLWLVTHSDSLLREAVGQPGFSVFHMQPGNANKSAGNQISAISVGEALDRAVVDLIGDLATYQPGGKVVVFEGGGSSEFDARMTTTLFPTLRTQVNTISAGHRGNVERLHSLLRDAQEAGTLTASFFSIVDHDSNPVETSVNSYSWDRYHIENYLLEPKYILAVLKDLNISERGLQSTSGIRKRLIDCAEKTLGDLVRHQLEMMANDLLVSEVKTSVSREEFNVATRLHNAVVATRKRVDDKVKSDLSLMKLRNKEKKARALFKSHLLDDRWLKTFRGRDVLRRFTGEHVHRVKYEVFRDLILAKMRDHNFQPVGMQEVVNKILNA